MLTQFDAARPSKWNRVVWTVFPVAGFLLSGCGENAAPVVATPPDATATSDSRSASDQAEIIEPYEKDLGLLKITVPTGWFEIPPRSDVLMAEFQLPGTEGVGRLTCSGAGGDVEMNLDRWRGQFQTAGSDVRPKRTEIEIAGKQAIVLDLAGTFTDGFAKENAVIPNAAMVGIVLPLENTNFFIKATGPETTIQQHREAILEFAKSIRLKSN